MSPEKGGVLKQSISFEDLSLFEKVDLGGVEVTIPRGEAFNRLFTGKKFSAEGRAFAKHFYEEVMHDIPDHFDVEDKNEFFSTVCEQISLGTEGDVLKKLLLQSAQLRFKPLESPQKKVEENKKQEISFEDPTLFQKKDLGGIEVTWPQGMAFEQLFFGKKFSEEGREFAKHFYEEVIDQAVKNGDTSVEDFERYFSAIHLQLSEGGKEGLLRKFLYQSAKFRLEQMARTKHLEELQASNSPFAALLTTLKIRYEKIPAQFSHNLIISSIITSKRFLSVLGEDMIRKDAGMLSGGASKGVLSAFLEKKFSEALEQTLQGSPELKLKELMNKVQESMNVVSLQEEFHEHLNRIPTVQAVEEAVDLPPALSFVEVGIVPEEHVEEIREIPEGSLDRGDSEGEKKGEEGIVLQETSQHVVDLRPNIPEREPMVTKVPASIVLEDGAEETLLNLQEDVARLRNVRTAGTEYYSKVLRALRRLADGEGDEKDHKDLEGIWEKNNLRWKPEYLGRLLEAVLQKDFEEDLAHFRDVRNRNKKEYETGIEMYRKALVDEGLRAVVCPGWPVENIARFLDIVRQEDELVKKEGGVDSLPVEERLTDNSSFEEVVSREAQEIPKKKGWLRRVLGERVGAKVGLVVASLFVAANTLASKVQEGVNFKHIGDSGAVRQVLTQETSGVAINMERGIVIEKDSVNVGSHYYKFTTDRNEKYKGVVIDAKIPTIRIDPTRWHTAIGKEGFDKTGPMDRPSIYVGGTASGTEFEGGLTWDRVYNKDGKSTEEFAYRIFLRAPGVGKDGKGWFNPDLGSEANVYFRAGERVTLKMEARGPHTMVLIVRGEGKKAIEFSFSLSDTSNSSYKYVVAIDQFRTTATGERKGNEKHATIPTKTQIQALQMYSAYVESKNGGISPLGFFNGHVIRPADVNPPLFKIHDLDLTTGGVAFEVAPDVGPQVAGIGSLAK